MEEKHPQVRSHWLHLRLRPEEHQKLIRKFKATTCRKLSEFVRNCLFEKPITVLQRNASLDSGLQGLSELQEELRAIGQNLNQIAHKVNGNPALAANTGWQASFTVQKQSLQLKIEELSDSINTLSELWLR